MWEFFWPNQAWSHFNYLFFLWSIIYHLFLGFFLLLLFVGVLTIEWEINKSRLIRIKGHPLSHLLNIQRWMTNWKSNEFNWTITKDYHKILLFLLFVNGEEWPMACDCGFIRVFVFECYTQKLIITIENREAFQIASKGRLHFPPLFFF